MDRRDFMRSLVTVGALGALGACGRRVSPSPDQTEPAPARAASRSSSRMPAIFLAHGSPMLLDDAAWVAELGAWGRALPRPTGILVLSAHWVDDPITLGATKTVPLEHDFYGFPKRHYQVTYPAPGAPALASRVKELLGPARAPIRASERGLDHGAYVPLVAMFPAADVPVLQVSMPTLEPARLFALGRALAPLRDEGVLVVGSGFLTHNMRAVDLEGRSPPPSWATELDTWAAEVLARHDVDALIDYRARAPGVRQALPTHEHFAPVIATVGAATGSAEPVTFPITGFCYGSFTRRSVQLG